MATAPLPRKTQGRIACGVSDKRCEKCDKGVKTNFVF